MLDPDARASRQVQLGFEREGIETVAPGIPTDLGKLEIGLTNGDIAGLALVGGSDVNLVARARELLVDVPILFTGKDGKRDELIAAGADAVLSHPVYLRDVVTIGRILRNVPPEHRDHLVGSLVETSGVYALVRALCSLGRSAVLTLIRGLRRGEIRFYRGEVTSAQVGLIHGQAAFHQLLLWTDARFDFAYEDIVKRGQIPLTSAELFEDAERFLEGVRESADLLSPSMVLEVDTQRVQNLGKQVPTEVHGVLRMFDGHRVLADILEDSPYRVFETLRVAQKAMEAGLLKQVAEQRPKTSWRAVLAIEEWLVGSETRDQVVERTAPIDTAPVSRQSKPKFKKGKKGKKARTTAPIKVQTQPNEIDWGALVPRTIGAEVGSLAGVVPAMDTHGEIDVASRDKQREKLEALMDTDKRQRIFPTEIGLEPSVVIRSEDTDEWEKIEQAAKAKVEAEAKASELEALAAAERAKAEAHAKALAEAQERARLDEEAAAKAKAEADAKAAHAKAVAEAEARAKLDEEAARQRAEAKAKAEADEAKAKADREQAEAKAKAEREEAARKSAAEEAKEYAAKVKAAAEAKRLEEEREAAEKADRATASMVATPTAPASEPATAAAVAAASGETSPERERTRSTDAKELVRELVTDAVPAESSRVVVASPITVAETSTATVQVADQMTVEGTKNTAKLTAIPVVTVTETPKADAAAPVAPIASEDEPSDGTPQVAMPQKAPPVVRQPAPEHDGPPQKQAIGEISRPEKSATTEVTQGPSILVDPEPEKSPAASDPATLVADLAAAHAAIAAAAAKAATTPSKGDAASASKEMLVSEVRKDAVEFTEDEEAFFNAPQSHTHAAPKFESFDDLDEGYEPPKFWDRVFGRKKKKS